MQFSKSGHGDLVVGAMVMLLCFAKDSALADNALVDSADAKVRAEKFFQKQKQEAAGSGAMHVDAEAGDLSRAIDKVADTMPAGRAAKLREENQAVQKYRKLETDFRAMGGADVETLKSPDDLSRRRAMLVEAKTNLENSLALSGMSAAERGHNPLHLEQEILDKMLWQLDFAKAHYGKWEVTKGGQTVFDLSPTDLSKYNEVIGEINDLMTKERKAIQEDADRQLHLLRHK